MSNNKFVYSQGDMVVHHFFGVGQIVDVEKKNVNGVQGEFFKVKTENSTFWFSTDTRENPRIHPVASEERIGKMINILRSPPANIDDDPLEWKDRYSDVQVSGDILAISGLVRDLNALKKQSKLTHARSQALENLEDRLLDEWAASLGVDVKQIRPAFQAYLDESLNAS